MGTERFDIIIVGCGISGISAAYHLSKYCPKKRFVVLERRQNLGGTWDLFTYPGIRSDSDMFTFGFGWRNWTNNCIVSPKKEILEYLNAAVDENSLRPHIRFNQNVLSASFSSESQQWTLKTETGPTTTYECQYLMFNTGYYSYENPYVPEFPGVECYKGAFFHPQHWPESLDCKDKKIIVIGSGATAATLVPALVDGGASEVTMLQRSPSYFVTRENQGDWFYGLLRPLFGESIAYYLNRWRYIVMGQVFFEYTQMFPRSARKLVRDEIREEVPKDFDVELHFKPKYGVWEQRLCLVPDGDFFQCLHQGTAKVVTDEIQNFAENGIQTRSGQFLEADIVVSATGLSLQENFPMSSVDVDVDGVRYNAPDHFLYRGCMLSDIPNFMFTLGYSNAGWTLKADLVSKYFCDMINHCDSRGLGRFCARAEGVEETPNANLLGLKSGYLQRSQGRMPKQGKVQPWVQSHNVLKDYWRYKMMPFGKEISFEIQKGKNAKKNTNARL